MSGFTFGSYASLGSANQTITSASSAVFGTVDNAGKTATEVSVNVTYHASAVLGANIQVERDIDGTNFEAEASSPWTIPVAFTAGATREAVFSIDANLVGKCRIRVVNKDTGQSITNANVRVKQATYS